MRRTLSILTLLLALLTSQVLFAQDGGAQPADDVPFLIIFVIIVGSVCLGLMITGAVISMLLLLITLAMTSAGIVSAALVVGLYKRSVTAGFKTLLILSSAIGGAAIGIAGLYLVNEIFNFHLSRSVMAWSGLAGGVAGGILLALVIIHIIRILFSRFVPR